VGRESRAPDLPPHEMSGFRAQGAKAGTRGAAGSYGHRRRRQPGHRVLRQHPPASVQGLGQAHRPESAAAGARGVQGYRRRAGGGLPARWGGPRAQMLAVETLETGRIGRSLTHHARAMAL
jgi:hypothetical protein